MTRTYVVDEDLVERHETLDEGDMGRSYVVICGAIQFVDPARSLELALSRMNERTEMQDNKTCSVVGINGFRRDNMGRAAAISLARRMQAQMRLAGWAGEMRVYFRGVSINWREEAGTK